MWRNLVKRASFQNLKNPSYSKDSNFIHKIQTQSLLNSPNSLLGFRQISAFTSRNCSFKENPVSNFCRSYGTAAARLISSTDESDYSGSDELQDLYEQHKKQQEKKIKMVGGMSIGKYQMLKRRQIKNETEAWEKAAEEYQELLEDMCEKKLAPNLPYVKSLFLGWFEPLRDAIDREQLRCMGTMRNRLSHAPYFNDLPPDMMAVITMHKLMALLMSSNGGNGTVRVVQAAVAVGEGIETEARIHRFLEKTKKTKKGSKEKKTEGGSNEDLVEEEKNNFDKVSNEQQRLRNKIAILMGKQKRFEVIKIVRSQGDFAPWGQEGQVKVGCMLLQLLIETAYIQPPMDQLGDNPPDIRPAFVHTFKNVTNDAVKTSRRYGVIECDALVRKGLEKSARHMVIPYMPMLVPPVNWTGYDRGAYLFLPSFVMRTHGAKQQRDVVKRTPQAQLEHVFEALDTLGNTRWRINKKVLSVVDRIWASGGRLAGLVDRGDAPEPEQPATEDEIELRKWKWKIKNVRKENSERHSQRCDIELKLAVARKMKDEEGFYYPHNLDFRGRAYPMHPHLNHLGSDICRGILEFSEGRPLGKSGLHWLKIHLANVYGHRMDKLSYDGRIEFTESHVDEIFDSADRPLEGKRWWLGAEDPFQCLATCFNLTEALRSSNPEETLSYLPIHQDGSCNGLQHYAALGRDKIGAAAVNLVTGEKPADVYQGIAARVHDIMQRDAQLDPTDSNAKHAKLLVNEVDRKLVKQTVMTSVYGVTYIGARDQIKRRLKERNTIADDQELYSAACYAAKTTLTALQEMFEGARSIMGWLGDCAQVIAKDNRKPVQWTTPLGLPVVQPYKKFGRQLVKTSLQILALQRETDQVMVKRQRTAFPPNFVHSLDGSHMMMTAIACKRSGLNFAGVHDSYWTHACDVDEMNKILREKFVELYETPILENLLEGFQKSFPKSKFPPLPVRGDLDLKESNDDVTSIRHEYVKARHHWRGLRTETPGGNSEIGVDRRFVQRLKMKDCFEQ